MNIFNTVRRVFNKAVGATPSVREGRAVQPDRTDVADLLSGDLTLQRVKAFLKEAAYGEPARQSDLADQMIELEPRIGSLREMRLLALRLRPWEVVSAMQVGRGPVTGNKVNEQLAADTANYCADVLSSIRGLEEALDHLGEAVCRSTSVVEIEYVGGKPIAAHSIPYRRLRADSQNVGRILVASEKDWKGIALDDPQFGPGKFIVHTPRPIGGSPLRGGRDVAALCIWAMSRLIHFGWVQGIEKYGWPWAIGKHLKNASAADKAEMVKILRDVGLNRGGLFEEGTDIELVEPQNSSASPHKDALTWLFQGVSINYVGNATTADSTGQPAGLGQAGVQVKREDVRDDIRDDDNHKKGNTIRTQFFRPLVLAKFGERVANVVPCFRHVIEEPKDLAASADLADKAVNKLGAPIKMAYVVTELGLPVVEGTNLEAPLPGQKVSSGFDPFAVGDGESDTAVNKVCRCGTRQAAKLLAHRTLDAIVSQAGPLTKAMSWMLAAIAVTGVHTSNVLGQFDAFLAKHDDSVVALERLPELFDQLPTREMAELQRHYLTAGQLAGRLETKVNISRKGNAAHKQRLVAQGFDFQAHAAELSFEPIRFVKAIDSLKDRVGLNPEEFLELDTQARSRAWRVAGVWDMNLLAVLHTQLALSIKNGETSRDFSLRMPQMFEQKGWSGENPHHADLVHYQNFAAAHSAGRYAEAIEFGINAWQFVASPGACARCAPLDGKKFAIRDRRYWNPLHFGCGCWSEELFDGEFDHAELAASKAVTSPVLDAERLKPSAYKFDPASYANLEPLNLAGFPEKLQPVFRKFGEAQGWEVVNVDEAGESAGSAG